MSFDDFIWDIVTLVKRSKYKSELLDMKLLDSIPPKRLALAIAAWHEANVLEDVINNIIESTHYPKSMYQIFLGVYPNDLDTLNVANKLSENHSNIKVVVNNLPGPTSKAQNINYVIQEIKKFEILNSFKFASLTVHDSEDVVHPYELKVTNFLLDKHDALQFPVYPLLEMPRFKNFFKNITTGTYADEFAENHYISMVGRYSTGAFVPSAGTGFVLSRKVIDSFGNEDVLPKDSLTEDYRLSLTLFEKNIRMYYVLERVPRISSDNKLVNEFIATRSMFPNTFKTAVKQKTRWILGITMQSFKFKDILKSKNLSFIGRYSMYKDLKAKVGNLLSMIGYPVLIYFLISIFIDLDPIYPKYSLSWYLSLLVTIFMVERQVFRSIAIYNVYGMRSVFFACFFPPLLPVRVVWGNIINMSATLKAFKQRFFGNNSKPEKKAVKSTFPKLKKFDWDKTEHSFLEKNVLKRFHRKLGDVLLEKELISSKALGDALLKAKEEDLPIGRYLLKSNLLTEEQLLNALSNIKNIQYVDISTIEEYHLYEFSPIFDENLLRSLKTVPILKIKSGYVFMFCDESPIDAQTTLKKAYGIDVRPAFGSESVIDKGLDIMYSNVDLSFRKSCFINELYEKDIIGYEELIIARNYKQVYQMDDQEVLFRMGVDTRFLGNFNIDNLDFSEKKLGLQDNVVSSQINTSDSKINSLIIEDIRL